MTEPQKKPAWTLNELHKAGKRGCTPIERPAPRWSHYVWRLRRDWGLNIETVTERSTASPVCLEAGR